MTSTSQKIRRRRFLKGVVASSLVTLTAPGAALSADGDGRRDYRGPRVIIVRFGGGCRRRESIVPASTYSPYLCRELTRRGVLFPQMEIDQFKDINTSHGEGTLYILTGKYEKFKDVGGKFLGARFEASVPTVFEYLRSQYQIADHQTLIVNGEDRSDEEFYNFSNHHLFGARYRSNTLSLRRFKTYLLRQQIQQGRFQGKELTRQRRELAKMEVVDYRSSEREGQGAELSAFWERWRQFYGESGLVNPRGDRLLTELALRAMKELRPRLMMINYNDCDYVHWGHMSHYTRAISIMDQGLKELVAAADADPEYRDNTIFVVVPDCGRDTNPFAHVPCQHHFNSRSAHEIFCLVFGPGIEQGTKVDRPVDQVQIAGTIGKLMGFPTPEAEGRILEEIFS